MDNSNNTWKMWLPQGDQYLKAGSPKNGKSKFGTDILYNLLSMSLESYIMAILDYKKNLPDNHTYTDLVNGLERVMPLDPSLKHQILKYESIQSICSVDKYSIKLPTEDEINDLRDAIMKIKMIAYETCPAVSQP
jgi:hypothetical protein